MSSRPATSSPIRCGGPEQHGQTGCSRSTTVSIRGRWAGCDGGFGCSGPRADQRGLASVPASDVLCRGSGAMTAYRAPQAAPGRRRRAACGRVRSPASSTTAAFGRSGCARARRQRRDSAGSVDVRNRDTAAMAGIGALQPGSAGGNTSSFSPRDKPAASGWARERRTRSRRASARSAVLRKGPSPTLRRTTPNAPRCAQR